MPRQKNPLETEPLTLSIIEPTRRYLELLVRTGLYGNNNAEAAKIVLLDHLKLLVEKGKLKEMKAEDASIDQPSGEAKASD